MDSYEGCYTIKNVCGWYEVIVFIIIPFLNTLNLNFDYNYVCLLFWSLYYNIYLQLAIWIEFGDKCIIYTINTPTLFKQSWASSRFWIRGFPKKCRYQLAFTCDDYFRFGPSPMYHSAAGFRFLRCRGAVDIRN